MHLLRWGSVDHMMLCSCACMPLVGNGQDTVLAGTCWPVQFLSAIRTDRSLTCTRCPFSAVSTSVRLPRRWVTALARKCAVSVPRLVSRHGTVATRKRRLTMYPAGMYALRERRQYVGQEDFEMAVAKVLKKNAEGGNTSVNKLFS